MIGEPNSVDVVRVPYPAAGGLADLESRTAQLSACGRWYTPHCPLCHPFPTLLPSPSSFCLRVPVYNVIPARVSPLTPSLLTLTD